MKKVIECDSCRKKYTEDNDDRMTCLSSDVNLSDFGVDYNKPCFEDQWYCPDCLNNEGFCKVCSDNIPLERQKLIGKYYDRN